VRNYWAMVGEGSTRSPEDQRSSPAQTENIFVSSGALILRDVQNIIDLARSRCFRLIAFHASRVRKVEPLFIRPRLPPFEGSCRKDIMLMISHT